MISFMGKIVSLSTYIKVEEIHFVNELDEILEESISLEKGEHVKLHIKVLPELASDKRYELSMKEKYKEICSLDQEGNVTGLKQGVAEILVKSIDDSRKTDKLLVKVTESKVQSVALDKETLTLGVGGSYKFTAVVNPSSAENKYLDWTSSSPAVTVSANGEITVKYFVETPVIITATSRADKTKSASCTITITNDTPALIFTPLLSNQRIYEFNTDTLDLTSILTWDDTKVNIADVQFAITKNASSSGATLLGSVLTVTNQMQIFEVEASYGSYKTKMFLIKTNI